MIRNADDLRLVQEQQQRVIDVLKSIEARVRPVNESRFELIAEAYRDQIAALQAEIDEYLARISPARKRRSG
jgi:hypothetical protein